PANRLLKLSRLTRARAWRPVPMRRSPSNASTSKRITRRSTANTRAVVRTTAPTGEAARWRISTSVPTVTQPGSRYGLMASADALPKQFNAGGYGSPLSRGRRVERICATCLHRLALDKGLAALHLMGQRCLVDLDDDGVGVDAEVLHQRLRDVAHHAGLLFVG